MSAATPNAPGSQLTRRRRTPCRRAIRTTRNHHRIMKKMKLVVVGNGIAGIRTIEERRKLDNALYDITVFGSEPHPNYNRILLSPVLTGDRNSTRLNSSH